MPAGLLLLPILLPIVAGLALLLWRPEERARRRFCQGIVVCNAALVLLVLVFTKGQALTLLAWNEPLRLLLRVDGFGALFAALVALLWPLTTLYAFSYMAHEGGDQNGFFAFFLIAFGLVMGVALAGNFLTLYTFYELLTFATLPLVMFGTHKAAKRAGRTYLIYAMLGAALVFAAWMLLLLLGAPLDFRYGGVILGEAAENALVPLAFLLAFFGFGIKAAIFPFHAWLPAASVAPTPVTALLHAVAVVKAGVFCVGRLIYFLIGPALLAGTWVQSLAIAAAALSILVATLLALRCTHLKRRLAYSTMANLSYILLAFALGTQAGFFAGSLHLLVHAIGKITLFFCAGAVLIETEQQEISEMSGLAWRLPRVFLCFAICAMALVGIPPLSGFSTKWLLLGAALEQGSRAAAFGMLALGISSFASAIYLGAVLLRAYGRGEGDAGKGCDPDWRMRLPLLGLTLATLLLSAFLPRVLEALRMLLLG